MKYSFGISKLLIVLIISSICNFALSASNQNIIYQGRIIRPDGTAVNSGTITFTLSLYSPNPSKCLLYSETQSVGMSGSAGMFSLQLGAGSRTDGGAHSFKQVFVNGGSLSGLTCDSGTSYSPTATDDRELKVSFNDSGTVVSLSSMSIKSVPFALQAAEIGGYGVNDLVKVHPTTGSATTFTAAEMAVAKVITALACANNEIIKYNGTTWACAADATGGSPSDASYAAKGVVQFDTNAATSGISVAAGVAKLSNTGVAANTYGSATKVGTFTVDAQGRITSASDANIAIPASQITQSGANNGEVLKWNGTNWVPSSDLGTTTDASYAAKGIIQFNTDAATSGISIAAGVATVNTGTGANQIVKLDGTGKLPAVDGSALTGVTATGYSGVLPIANGGTNSSTALNNDRMMISSGGKIVEAPAMTNGQIMIGSTGAAPMAATLSQSNGISITNGAGTISIATNATSANTVSTIVSRDASGNFAAGTATFNSTKLNGSTSGTLTFTVPTTVTDYTIRWPGAVGAAGTFLTTDASGNLSWGSPAAISDASYAVKGAVQFDTNAATSGISVASGVASVNTGTGANQIVKLDGTGKLPAIDASALTNLNPSNLSAAVGVAKGGTGLTAGTSGGIPFFDSTSTMASSGLLTLNGVLLGGGAGGAPTSTAAGAAHSVLRVPSGGGAPAFGAIDLSQSAAVTGALAVGNGGTGASSFAANRLIGTNGTGTAQVAVTCSLNQVLSFDASGNYNCQNVSSLFSGFTDGGNTFTAGATLGTNSNHSLTFETNNSGRMVIDNAGKVGIGTAPSHFFHLNATSSAAAGTYNNVYNALYTDGIASSATVNGISNNVFHTWGGNYTGEINAHLNSLFHGNALGTGALSLGRGAYNYFSSWGGAGSTPGNVTTGIGAENIAANGATPTVSSGEGSLAITNLKGSLNKVLQNDAGTTVSNAYGAQAEVTSSAGTISSAYGVHADVNGAGTITNAYGVYIDALAGTNKWGLYQAGSSDLNYFAGNLGLGASDPATILDVNGAITQRGMAAPGLSSAGQGRIYFDSTANKFKVSQNGAAYTDLVSGITGPAGADKQVQFNDGGTLAGSGIYWDKTNKFLGVNTSSAGYAHFGILGNGATYSSPQNAVLMYLMDSTGAVPNFSIKNTYFVNPVELEMGSNHNVGGYFGTVSDDPLIFQTNSLERFRVSANGNVGIGITTPSEILDVSGGVRIGKAPAASSTLGGGGIGAADVTIGVTSTAGYPTAGTLKIENEVITYTGISGNNFTGVTRGVWGTTAAVHAAGTSVENYLLMTNKSATSTPSLVVTSSGNVGIGGYVNPNYSLHVLGESRVDGVMLVEAEQAGGSTQFVLSQQNVQNNQAPKFYFTGANNYSHPQAGDELGILGFLNAATYNTGAKIIGVAAENHGATATGAELQFHTTPLTTGAPLQRMTITADGNVGIGAGATAPSAKLEIAGQVRSVSSTGSTKDNGTTTVDWNEGNAQSMSVACTATTLSNMLDGGTYILAVTETGTTQCTFSAAGLTFYYNPANAARTSGTRTVYTFQRIGNDVYVSWSSGFAP